MDSCRDHLASLSSFSISYFNCRASDTGFRAVATRYHAGQISAQLRVHKPLLLHAEIINTVTAAARTMAEPSLIRVSRKPWRTPQIAGSKNRSRQNLDIDSTRN